MSAKALFVSGPLGDYYTPVDDLIATLPKGKRVAAALVWNAIIGFLPKDKTELRITDRMLRQSLWLKGYSFRFIQKGLNALEFGLGLIERKRRRGLRGIIILARLRKRETQEAPKVAPKAKTFGIVPAATPAQIAAAAERARQVAEGPRPSTPEEDERIARMVEEQPWNRAAADQRQRNRPVLTPPPPSYDQAETERRRAKALADLKAAREGRQPDTGAPEAPTGP